MLGGYKIESYVWLKPEKAGKEEKKRKKKSNEWKTVTNMVDINLTKSTIPLDVNNLVCQLKQSLSK